MSTYKLDAGYYDEVLEFTQSVLVRAQKYRPIIKEYSGWSKSQKTDLEYLLEFLMIGVYWQVYSRRASGIMPFKYLLKKMSHWRLGGPLRKRFWDKCRGTILYNFYRKEGAELAPDPQGLKRLLDWLSACGEFSNQVLIMGDWQAWFASNPSKDYLGQAINFAHWFEAAAEAELGKFTNEVQKFFAHQGHQEDFFTKSGPLEYHLNMVGAEMLNLAWRKDFLETSKKTILLPRCMRVSGSNCPAKRTVSGYLCVGCSRNCPIAKLSKLVNQDQDVNLYIIPHESQAFQWRRDGATEGVVGIACVLTLLEGGYGAKNLELPAQCVLLDYCGCKHWGPETVTDINLERFKEIVEI